MERLDECLSIGDCEGTLIIFTKKDEQKDIKIIFQCYQQQKFLDVILVMEEGTLFCHKIVLDSCSEYFASIFKNKFLDDKNKNIVICLPKDILLWEMQALLSYMYNGEVNQLEKFMSMAV